MTQFEADLSPDTMQPRVRFNFSNGWSASILVRTGANPMLAMMASLAACPTGRWQDGITELGPTEAFADEAIEWLYEISKRDGV